MQRSTLAPSPGTRSHVATFAVSLVTAAFAIAVLLAGPGGSDTGPPFPTGPPRAAIARAAIDRMFADGFHFVETDVTGKGSSGRTEDGDWIPPNMFHKRIHWDQAADYATNSDGNPPMSEACKSADGHRADWRELVEGTFGGYQTYVLLELYRNEITVSGDTYRGSINTLPATFKVQRGYVVEMHDSSGYDYRYSNFGLPKPVDCRP